MTKTEACEFVKRLMLKSEALHLATVDKNGNPQIRAMVNLRNPSIYPKLMTFFSLHPNPMEVFVATESGSDKSIQIRHHPQVAVYFDIPVLFFGVMLTGTMKPVNDVNIRETLWQDEWLIYFPKGWTDPTYEVFSLDPDRMKGWNNSNVFDFLLGEKQE